MLRALTVIFLLLIWSSSHASEYAIVVSRNLNIEAMDAGKVRDVFLKKRNFDKSIRLFPVNLLGEEKARREFETKILGMDRGEINRYWVKKHFQGVSPPTTQASLSSIKRFVEKVDGAIGYLPVSMVDTSLKIVYEF